MVEVLHDLSRPGDFDQVVSHAGLRFDPARSTADRRILRAKWA